VRNNKSIEAICWKEKSFNKFSEKNLKARRVGASELRLNEIRKFAANGKTFLSPPSPRQATPELEPFFLSYHYLTSPNGKTKGVFRR
jgi:hypothetical protein